VPRRLSDRIARLIGVHAVQPRRFELLDQPVVHPLLCVFQPGSGTEVRGGCRRGRGIFRHGELDRNLATKPGGRRGVQTLRHVWALMQSHRREGRSLAGTGAAILLPIPALYVNELKIGIFDAAVYRCVDPGDVR